jgi:hypothetical protein
MKHLTIGLLVGGLLGAAVAAYSQQFSPEDYRAYGYGVGSSCGQWLRDSAKDYAPGQQWMLGYISGAIAVRASNQATPLRKTDSDGVFAFLNQYCQAHPLDRMTRAARFLYEALREQP